MHEEKLIDSMGGARDEGVGQMGSVAAASSRMMTRS